jgi:hypothetical protein
MDLIRCAYERLYPEKEFIYQAELNYNNKLSNFNANIKRKGNNLIINVNTQWKDIDDEIKIGLIQSLLVRIFKSQLVTPNIKIYNNFIKNLSILTPKTKSDPFLEESFYRVNEQYFNNQMEKPNLIWGQDSLRTLATYNFHNDTVKVSSIFRTANNEIVDYLMYHELLHKEHKFNNKKGRSYYHTSSFRADEDLYPNKNEIDFKISQIIKNHENELKRDKNKKFNLLSFFKQ